MGFYVAINPMLASVELKEWGAMRPIPTNLPAGLVIQPFGMDHFIIGEAESKDRFLFSWTVGTIGPRAPLDGAMHYTMAGPALLVGPAFSFMNGEPEYFGTTGIALDHVKRCIVFEAAHARLEKRGLDK